MFTQLTANLLTTPRTEYSRKPGWLSAQQRHISDAVACLEIQFFQLWSPQLQAFEVVASVESDRGAGGENQSVHCFPTQTPQLVTAYVLQFGAATDRRSEITDIIKIHKFKVQVSQVGKICREFESAGTGLLNTDGLQHRKIDRGEVNRLYRLEPTVE